MQDFYTGDPIDVLRSRRNNVTEPYFVSLPVEERNNVKYLLTDMYNPYLLYIDKYFPNAVPVVDSFHVIQWVIHAIDMYIRTLVKYYRERDREAEAQKSMELGHPVTLPVSDELYLLMRYRWLVLANQSNITYHTDLKWDSHYRRLMNTYDYERELFNIDSRLKELRDLKEKYVSFNARYAGQPMVAAEELDKLITFYCSCGETIFQSFADLLKRYREPIVNSFIMVENAIPEDLCQSALQRTNRIT